MSIISQPDESEDEFESADEGESLPTPIVKTIIPPPLHSIVTPINNNQVQQTLSQSVTDGWGDWNIDDDDDSSLEKSTETSNPTILQQDSTLLLSKTDSNLPQNGCDEDDQNQSSEQQRLQRKKIRKKQLETNQIKEENKINTRISRPVERREEESSSTVVPKHNVNEAHAVLDRLAAQSPTRTVYSNKYIFLLFNILLFSQTGIHRGAILDPFYPQQNKVLQH